MLSSLTSIPWLTLLTFSPLLGVLLLLMTPGKQVTALRAVGVITTLLPLVLVVLIYADYASIEQGKSLTELFGWISIPLNTGMVDSQIASWSFNIQYHMSIDGISLPMVVLTALITTMAAVASLTIVKRVKTYFILLLLLEVGMLGVFMARDLYLFFAFFEWTLVPTFFLIGIWGFANREKAANRFLIYNGLGSALMLVAFVILTVSVGLQLTPTADGLFNLVYSGNLDTIISQIGNASSPMNTSNNVFYLSEGWRMFAFVLLIIAFGIKLPIFPFHTWMLRVHAEAPIPVVMLHSGVLLKMGAYGLIQFAVVLLPAQAGSWTTALAILGIINIVYGAVLAFVQKEFRLVLAYSSISHMGFVLFGISAMNEIGLQGAVLQMVSHGFISALFFLLVGSLLERTSSTSLQDLGGLAKSMPFISGLLLIAGLASLGLPGLSGFPAELFSLLGLFDTMPWAAIIGTLGLVLSAVYVLRAVLAITYGPIASQHEGLKDARFAEALPAIILTVFIIWIGIFPSVVTDPINTGVEHIIDILKVRG